MISFPFEVGVLGWASTFVFWLAAVMMMVDIARVVIKKKSP